MADRGATNQTFSISTGTIFKILLIVLGLWFLFVVRNVLGILFVSMILTAGITPWVDWLEDRKIPRIVGAVLLYAVLLGIFSLVVILIIPPLSKQITQIISTFPEYYNKIIQGAETLQGTDGGDTSVVDSIQQSLQVVNQSLQQVTKGIFSGLITVFGGFASFLSIMVITFYLTQQRNGAKKIIHSLAPTQYQPYLVQLGNRIAEKLGSWLRGQLFLCLVIFILSYIGLSILGVKYALVLALIAGIFEFIPFIGPVAAAVPALFFSFAQSPVKALLVLILYVVIQQLENQILVPKVMQKSVGLNPVIVIIAMLVGGQLGGILGVMLAVPTAAIIQVFTGDFLNSQRDKENQLDEGEAP